MRSLLLVLVVACSAPRASGPPPRNIEEVPPPEKPGTAYVRVLDSDTMTPIAGAQVVFDPGHVVMTTKPDGDIFVPAIVAGTYKVTVSKPGYITAEQDAKIPPNGGGVVMNFHLDR